MGDPIDLLKSCGWYRARQKTHEVWKCPCGKHQMVFSKTPSDGRAYKNFLKDLLKMDCESVDAIRPPETEEVEPGVCMLCHKNLEPTTFKKEWVRHGEVTACLSHHGIKGWSRRRGK
jgi:hypothetical protein